MRVLVLLLALGLASLPAWAQKGAAARSQPAFEATEAGRTAGRGVARAFLIDSGVVDAALRSSFDDQLPALRAELSQRLSFRGLAPARQAAIDAEFARLPAIFREEIDQRMPALIARVGDELAGRFSEADLVALDRFFAMDEARSVLRRGAATMASEDESARNPAASMLSGMTPQEAQVWLDFASTDAGAAFAAQSDFFGSRIRELMMETLTPAIPAMVGRFQAGLCAALESDCPPELRPL